VCERERDLLMRKMVDQGERGAGPWLWLGSSPTGCACECWWQGINKSLALLHG
jgi:hypothetical protein